MAKLDFYQRAEKLGHSVDALKKGLTINSVVSVPNVETLREIYDDGLEAHERDAREQAMFGHIPVTSAADDMSTAGITRRVQAHVYGNSPLSDADRKAIQGAFPMSIMAVSSEDQTWTGLTNLGVSTSPVILNYGTLTMADQSYAVIQNTSLSLTADALVRQGTAPSSQSDFNILGVTGANGGQGATGSTGSNGTNGKNGNCSSAGIAGDSGQNGTTGGTGGIGVYGYNGGNGLPSLSANITFATGFTGATNITVFTQSGNGGTG
ncbi:MAG: hypothetical protein ACRC3B_15980, partial [Bacteroidia bacterium]